MSREPLKNGAVLRFPDGQEYETVRLLGAGGSALLYEVKVLGSELYAAVKEIFPARGYVRKDGQILSASRLPGKEKALRQRKQSLLEQETRLSQKASRRNYQVLFLQPPVWHQAELRMPDGTVFSNVENTYVRMDSLAEKGVPLAQLVRDSRAGGGILLDEMLRVMKTILDAYAALHEDGFLHGDCQLSNLFLLKAGRGGEGPGTACIIDFGSARELGKDGLTAPVTDEVFSTDGYCAPELMFPRGGELRLSARADVWSLGFLLLNLLTDRGLDELDGITEYLMTHPEEKILTREELTEFGCSPAQTYLLNRILKQALANEPGERYPDAGQMREDLLKLERCRRMDTSKGIDRYLMWEAAWRYHQANPSLFQTEHTPHLVKELPVRRLLVKARWKNRYTDSVHLLFLTLEELGKNVYLYGSGGAGKSFAVAPLIARWMEFGERRVPLYLDLSAYTVRRLEQCGGDGGRVIPMLLAEQYFGSGSLEDQVDGLLKNESCFLVLDNLHKVERGALQAAFAALNRLQHRYPNVWAVVLGRAENPGMQAKVPEKNAGVQKEKPARVGWKERYRALWEEYDFEGDYEDELTFKLPKTPQNVLTLERVELLPLTTEQIVKQVKQVLGDVLGVQAGTSLLSQANTLGLPMFLMRYLEILSSDRAGGDALPNSAMELLHSYFTRQEYRANDRDVHELLNEQLPWIAYQYERTNEHCDETLHTVDTITEWLRERYSWELDAENFFRQAVDNLAVLEADDRDRYRFVHDCYQEYFAALFAANSIQQAVSRGSAEPLKGFVGEWKQEQTDHCLELCCLTNQNGKLVRIRDEREVLDSLYQVLAKCRRRELAPIRDFLRSVQMKTYLSAKEKDSWEWKAARQWGKLFVRSVSPLFSALVMPIAAISSLARPKLFLLRMMAQSTEDGEADYQLACCYKHGEHTRVNPEKAEKYLRRAIEKGYPPAYNAQGENEEKQGNYLAAADLYRQAADKHYPPALWHLGQLYLQGHGVGRNTIKAYTLFQKGAEFGDMPSQYTLGLLLEKGVGCHRDPQKALFWYEKAAEQGLDLAREAAEKCRLTIKTE